jgi:hypothetical protein
MLKLPSRSDALTWLDLIEGVRVRVRPHAVAAMLVAQSEARRVYREQREGGEGAELEPGSFDDRFTSTQAIVSMVSALAHYAIVEWEGVGDEDGNPAPVTHENIDRLMRHARCYERFDELYAVPAFRESAEKNDLSPSQNGTSEGATNTAGPASDNATPAPTSSMSL